MPKRGIIAIVFTIAGLRMILAYAPPSEGRIGSTSPTPSASGGPSASPSAGAGNAQFTGSKFNYNYGVMQVTVKVSGGKIIEASVSQSGRWPIGYRRNACTESVFNSAAIDLSVSAKTGADFMAKQPNACTGASYSWWGYASSLQAAVDKAGY